MDLTGSLRSFQQLLDDKHKELEDREAQIHKQERLFHEQHPQSGSSNDVIALNVGGRTGITTLRRTLTLCEDSMLAVKFCGRWDDSLERDREGNIFLDQDPDAFEQLLSILRIQSNLHGEKYEITAEKLVPTPSHSFLSMLLYYGLVPYINPILVKTIRGAPPTAQRRSNMLSPGTLLPVTTIATTEPGLLTFSSTCWDWNILSFDVVLAEQCKELYIGWMYKPDNNLKHAVLERETTGYTFTLDCIRHVVQYASQKCKFNCNLGDKVMGTESSPGNQIVREPGRHVRNDSDKSMTIQAGTVITCRRIPGSLDLKFLIDHEPVEHNLKPNYGGFIYPCISLQGSVQIQNVEYDMML